MLFICHDGMICWIDQRIHCDIVWIILVILNASAVSTGKKKKIGAWDFHHLRPQNYTKLWLHYPVKEHPFNCVSLFNVYVCVAGYGLSVEPHTFQAGRYMSRTGLAAKLATLSN